MTADSTLTSQQIATRALLDLLGQDLSPATWTIHPYGQPELAGQLDFDTPLDDRRAAIGRWAEALSTTPGLRRSHNPRPHHAGSLRIAAEHLGAQVSVWVALTEADIAELDAEQVPAAARG